MNKYIQAGYRWNSDNKIKCTMEFKHYCSSTGCNCSEGAKCCKVNTVRLSNKEEEKPNMCGGGGMSNSVIIK